MGTDSGPSISVAPRSGRARCPHCGTLLPSGQDRRFALTDVMILVAASAVAFLIVRPIIQGALFQKEPGWPRYLAVSLGVLITWTPTVLYLRLRGPRPPLHRLARQPGFAASVSGTTIIAIGILTIGLLALVRVARQGAVAAVARPGVRIPVRPPDPAWWLGVVLYFGAIVGPAVIGAWLLLAVSGRRRPSRGWIDPLGRVLGILWIALFVINCCTRLAYLRD